MSSLNDGKYEKWPTHCDGGNMGEREIGKFKRRQKDEIIVRKTCELTNDSLTLFNEIFFNCSKIILRLTQGF